MLTGVSSCNNM